MRSIDRKEAFTLWLHQRNTMSLTMYIGIDRTDIMILESVMAAMTRCNHRVILQEMTWITDFIMLSHGMGKHVSM